MKESSRLCLLRAIRIHSSHLLETLTCLTLEQTARTRLAAGFLSLQLEPEPNKNKT